MNKEDGIQAMETGDLEHASGGWRGGWGRGRGWVRMPGPDGLIYEYSADGSARRRPFNPGTSGPPYWYDYRY